MFNPFKKLLRKNDDDFDSDYGSDVRSHILGEKFSDSDENSSFQPPSNMQPPPDFNNFSQKTRDVFEPLDMQAPSISVPERLDKAAEKTSRDYEIMDRLSVIEATLSAIRSQTETINERLKNMEAKLGYRRY